MKERIVDFVGGLLCQLFEHKWLYRSFMFLGIVCICFMLKCSIIAYDKQLDVIVPSIHQLETITFDVFSFSIGYFLYQIEKLKRKYLSE